MLPTSIILSTLSFLALGAPVQERQLPRRRIHWRHGTDRTHLVICNNGPDRTPVNGNLLTFAPADLSSGQPVTNCTPDFQFDNSGADTAISSRSAGTQCIDATLGPGNGVRPHLWDCYPGVSQQRWKFGQDGTIRLSGTNLCLDVTDGNPASSVQLWECTECGLNPNQQWDVEDFWNWK